MSDVIGPHEPEVDVHGRICPPSPFSLKRLENDTPGHDAGKAANGGHANLLDGYSRS